MAFWKQWQFPPVTLAHNSWLMRSSRVYIYIQTAVSTANWRPCLIPNDSSTATRLGLWSSLGSWWRHQMENFSVLLSTCAGNSPVTGEFPAQRPETRSFDVFFDLRLNKRLSKQWRGWWFETPSHPLWRHCNVPGTFRMRYMAIVSIHSPFY